MMTKTTGSKMIIQTLQEKAKANEFLTDREVSMLSDFAYRGVISFLARYLDREVMYDALTHYAKTILKREDDDLVKACFDIQFKFESFRSWVVTHYN